MDFNKTLYEEIEDEFKSLRGIEVGTNEYKAGVDGLTKLMEKAIEIEKIDIEIEDRNEKRKEAKEAAEEARKAAKFEQELKLKQMEEDRKDRLIKNCISAAGIVLPLTITIWGTLKSLKFEEEGTVTTIMGRGFINKLLPKK